MAKKKRIAHRNLGILEHSSSKCISYGNLEAFC